MNKAAFFIVAGVIALVLVIYFTFNTDRLYAFDAEENYEIVDSWDMPAVLEEISGIHWIGDNKIACVMDEEGIIFIYDLDQKKIVKEIDFTGTGDFEAIRILENDAWVLRSDGELFEIKNYLGENITFTQYPTGLTARHNTEALSKDPNSNNLLLGVKDLEEEGMKNFYAFNLDTKELDSNPVFGISMTDSIFSEIDYIHSSRVMRPSDMEFHPQTGDLYVLDGASPKLLILDAKTKKPKNLYLLHPEKFNQPEGISFTPEGRLFISNEGGYYPGNILEVKLDKNKKTVEDGL
jgi:uncharacterized protein YjiK